MAPPLGAEDALFFVIVRRPPIVNVLQGKCSWRAPSGALQRRKIPPKSPSNDDRRSPSLGEVAPS